MATIDKICGSSSATRTVPCASTPSGIRRLDTAALPVNNLVMARSKVAVLKVKPDTVLPDTERLMELGGVRQALAPGKTTILKDNISWHFPFPAANTTPWQLEGTILG